METQPLCVQTHFEHVMLYQTSRCSPTLRLNSCSGGRHPAQCKSTWFSRQMGLHSFFCSVKWDSKSDVKLCEPGARIQSDTTSMKTQHKVITWNDKSSHLILNTIPAHCTSVMACVWHLLECKILYIFSFIKDGCLICPISPINSGLCWYRTNAAFHKF